MLPMNPFSQPIERKGVQDRHWGQTQTKDNQGYTNYESNNYRSSDRRDIQSRNIPKNDSHHHNEFTNMPQNHINTTTLHHQSHPQIQLTQTEQSLLSLILPNEANSRLVPKLYQLVDGRIMIKRREGKGQKGRQGNGRDHTRKNDNNNKSENHKNNQQNHKQQSSKQSSNLIPNHLVQFLRQQYQQLTPGFVEKVLRWSLKNANNRQGEDKDRIDVNGVKGTQNHSNRLNSEDQKGNEQENNNQNNHQQHQPKQSHQPLTSNHQNSSTQLSITITSSSPYVYLGWLIGEHQNSKLSQQSQSRHQQSKFHKQQSKQSYCKQQQSIRWKPHGYGIVFRIIRGDKDQEELWPKVGAPRLKVSNNNINHNKNSNITNLNHPLLLTPIYQGQFNHSLRHGTGLQLNLPLGWYEGPYQNDIKQGEGGVEIRVNAWGYQGRWKGGEMSGWGEMVVVGQKGNPLRTNELLLPQNMIDRSQQARHHNANSNDMSPSSSMSNNKQMSLNNKNRPRLNTGTQTMGRSLAGGMFLPGGMDVETKDDRKYGQNSREEGGQNFMNKGYGNMGRQQGSQQVGNNSRVWGNSSINTHHINNMMSINNPNNYNNPNNPNNYNNPNSPNKSPPTPLHPILTYSGTFRLNIMHGPCDHMSTSQSTYTGHIHNWLKHGYGRQYFYQTNDQYWGQYENGRFEGRGRYQWGNGGGFDGQWRNGERCGKGVFWGRGVKVGSAGDQVGIEGIEGGGENNNGINGSRELGIIDSQPIPISNSNPNPDIIAFLSKTAPNTPRYIGSYLHNFKQGYGQFHYQTGNFYKGTFLQDKPAGYGEYFWRDNDAFYKGEWMEGYPHGKGVVGIGGGEVRRGLFERGVMVGVWENAEEGGRGQNNESSNNTTPTNKSAQGKSMNNLIRKHQPRVSMSPNKDQTSLINHKNIINRANRIQSDRSRGIGGNSFGANGGIVEGYGSGSNDNNDNNGPQSNSYKNNKLTYRGANEALSLPHNRPVNNLLGNKSQFMSNRNKKIPNLTNASSTQPTNANSHPFPQSEKQIYIDLASDDSPMSISNPKQSSSSHHHKRRSFHPPTCKCQLRLESFRMRQRVKTGNVVLGGGATKEQKGIMEGEDGEERRDQRE